MDFHSLFLPKYVPTSPEEALFIAYTTGQEAEISRVAKEALEEGHPISHFRFNSLKGMAKDGYDQAWPLYAVALSHLLEKNEDPLLKSFLSKLHEIEAVTEIAQNAYDLGNIWTDGKAPVRLYYKVIYAVQVVGKAFRLSKTDLVNIAKIEEKARFFALHLQLVPELAILENSSERLETLRCGNEDERDLLILTLNRTLKHYSLTPPPEKTTTPRNRSSSAPETFLETISRENSGPASAATSPLAARKQSSAQSFFEMVSKTSSPHLIEASAHATAGELYDYTLALFQNSVRALSISQNRESLSPLTSLSNELSFFASLYVLQGRNTSERKHRYRGISQIIAASIERKNFHVALSLYQGLQRTELTRLNEFPPCQAHRKLFSPRGRWINLKNAMGTESHIPPIALFLGHLQPFIDGKEPEAIRECITTFAESHKGIIGSAPSQSSASTFMDLAKAIVGGFSQEELEEKLQTLSNSLKSYPSVVNYFSDGDL